MQNQWKWKSGMVVGLLGWSSYTWSGWYWKLNKWHVCLSDISASSCRHRLFRRLYSELYNSTDNKKSGESQVSASACPCTHLLSALCLFLSVPITHFLPFAFILSVCPSHMYTPVQSLWAHHCLGYLSFSLLPAPCPDIVRQTLKKTHFTFTLCPPSLSLSLSLAHCPFM